MEHVLKMQPGNGGRIEDNETLMLDEPDNFPPVPVMDTTFERNGRAWCVSSLCDTFVIGTAVDAQLDANGEPCRESDIIKVVL